MLLLPFLPLFFHMALADSEPIFLLMTSGSSGYLTFNRTWNAPYPYVVSKSVPVPPSKTIVVSYKELTPDLAGVRLYQHGSQSAGSGEETKRVVWAREAHEHSDFAQILQTHTVSVEVVADSCRNTMCFQLLFDFFTADQTPRKLPSGLWNCSVDLYYRFDLHVACNLKTECEDGRDEHEHCPHSSAECQGLLALCNHCYALSSQGEIHSHGGRDVNSNARQFCAMMGGQLGLPMCTSDWYGTVRNMIKMHPKRLSRRWVGLSMGDLSLPNMYKHSVVHEDRTAVHHTVTVNTRHSTSTRRCLATGLRTSRLDPERCVSTHREKSNGAICQLRANRNNGDESRILRSITLATTGTRMSPMNTLLTVCSSGHMTHSIFLCGRSYHGMCGVDSMSVCRLDPHQTQLLTPTFMCSDHVTSISFTLVCDFIADCHDQSDEAFCRHPACVSTFTCSNGQCLDYDKVCDGISHCFDASEERSCSAYNPVSMNYQYVPSPALIYFDGFKSFTSVPIGVNESCPDSHYRCPGDFNDCLPVYTRCNGMYDCLDQQDEEGCEEMMCPGFFRCRMSTICVHSQHLCDGWSHCPMNDDELLCHFTCPAHCLCQGYTLLCPQPFLAAEYPQLRYLDATGSGMTLTDIQNNVYLIRVVLAQCSLVNLPAVHLLNLKVLDLSDNKLQVVNINVFTRLDSLEVLSLSNNPLRALHSDMPAAVHQRHLTALDLSFTKLTVFDGSVLSAFPQIQKLNLTFTFIHTVSPGGFLFTPKLTQLYMHGTPLAVFPSDIFKGLSYLQIITTQNYKLCCRNILPSDFDHSSCIAPEGNIANSISSCEDLLPSWTYRAFLWLAACLTVTGNMWCIYKSFRNRKTVPSGFTIFIINLNVADFLMALYVVVVAVGDQQFRGKYVLWEEEWRSGVTCKAAGFVSLLSCEVSTLITWLVTVDRFIVLHFPFSTFRFERTSAAVGCLLMWLVGWLIGLVPLLPVSNWELYSQTGICTPVPVSRQDYEGRMYAFSVLIFFNLILVVSVSMQQIFTFCSVKSRLSRSSTIEVPESTTARWSQDVILARRMIGVVLTKFLCGSAVAVWGILSLAEVSVAVSTYAVLAVFVYPLSSALDPFLYLLMTLLEKRRRSREPGRARRLESRGEKMNAQ